MAFGFVREPQIAINDTKTLTAYLYGSDDQLVPQADIVSVLFTVVNPLGSIATPDVNAQPGAIIADGTGQYLVPNTINVNEGEYRGIAQFTFSDNGLSGLMQTSICNYDVYDPFAWTDVTPADPAIDLCWQKLEDCFDSEYGGTWLRDQSLANFQRSKIGAFVPDVLLEINAIMPQSEYDINSFPWSTDDGTAIFGWGLLLATIRHLMRSYTEQPQQTNSPVPWMDRTGYQQAWSVIYQIEKERYDELVRLFKVRTYADNGAALLVASKAGRLLPAPMRTRNIGRGYYVTIDTNYTDPHLHHEIEEE